MNEVNYQKLRDYAQSVFRGDSYSIHGPSHWRRVEDTVSLIAPETGADIIVARLFAIFHDCCRVNDDIDPDHGPRAAQLIHQIAGSQFTIDTRQLDLLTYAVSNHTSGRTSEDPTIGTCWDADRLDLGRVGITPSPSFMSTMAGKAIAELGLKYVCSRFNSQTQ